RALTLATDLIASCSWVPLIPCSFESSPVRSALVIPFSTDSSALTLLVRALTRFSSPLRPLEPGPPPSPPFPFEPFSPAAPLGPVTRQEIFLSPLRHLAFLATRRTLPFALPRVL